MRLMNDSCDNCGRECVIVVFEDLYKYEDDCPFLCEKSLKKALRF